MNVIIVKGNEVKVMIDNNKIDLIIDLRNNDLYENGHLPNAINIPINEIPDKLEFLDPYKNKTVLLCCGLGKQSISTGKVLILNGFQKIYSLSNGLKTYKFELEK